MDRARKSARVARILVAGVAELVTVFVSLPSSVANGAATSDEAISDHLDLVVAHRQDWGLLGIDTCAHAPEQTPLPLQIGARRYAKGLGLHANGEIVLDLGGAYARFDAEVGVQQQAGGGGSVVFEVFADDALVFTSPLLRGSDDAVAVSVPLAGCEELRLVATDGGDGIICDCADWGDARLTRAEPARRAAPRTRTDVAPCAAIRSWDWRAKEGTRAGRLDEFPAADLFPWTEPARDADGGCVLVAQDGRVCVGLEWREPRRLARLECEWAGAGGGTSARGSIGAADVVVEQWVERAGGGSTWQGRWVPLQGALRVDGTLLSFDLATRDDGNAFTGTTKIRWIVPVAAVAASERGAPPVVRALRAFSRSRWRDVELAVTTTGPEPPAVEVFNGARRDGLRGAAEPGRIALTACVARDAGGDRTLVRFTTGAGTFSVAVSDVLAHGGVWIPDAGLYVTDAAHPLTLDAYRARCAGEQGVLDLVHARPDQDFASALARLHDPRQDLGPTLLSLPADNRKFIVERDGTIRWDDRPELFDCVDHPPAEAWRCAATVRFGERAEPASRRRISDLSCLALELAHDVDAMQYSMETFVGAPASGEVLLAARNAGSAPATARFTLAFAHPEGVRIGPPTPLAASGARPARQVVVVSAGARELAWIEAAADTSIESAGANCTVRAAVAAGESVRARIVVPRRAADAGKFASWPDEESTRAAARAAWRAATAEMAEIELPDPELDAILHASILHCLAAARSADDAAGESPRASPLPSEIAPWIASVHYGPLESEAQSVIRGLQSLGARSFAAAAHRWFSGKIDANGRLTTGYTLIGTGWHLWTLGEYDQLFEDDATLRALEPATVRACRWIMAQRRKTTRVDASGRSAPESGLLPPGPLADWDVFAFYLYADANYCAGLRDAAAALARIGDAEAGAIAADATAFRADLLRASALARARAPVVPLRDGRFVPFTPTRVDGVGPIEEFHRGEDAGRSWCYDVEVGPTQLAALGLIDARSRECGWSVDFDEDVQFLRDGWFAFPAAGNVRDPFTFGGFSKVQPYYARTAETHALRDDAPAFLRSYFNALPTLLNREDLSLWEHFAANGAWNKTHETGYFLYQTRTLLLTERPGARRDGSDDELWLAPFVPRAWLADGKRLVVARAPTRFGPVDYRIASRFADRRIDVTLTPPTRRPPAALVLRLRAPGHARIRSVTVDGNDVRSFDAESETIRLPSSAGESRVVVRY